MVHQWNRHPDHHSCDPRVRPRPPPRSDTAHSRYVQMLLEQDDIPAAHNVLAAFFVWLLLAAFFVWLLLAGFLVFPGTFTSLQRSVEDKGDGQWGDKTTTNIIKSVKNMPLLVLAAVACGTAILGIASLALRHVTNYVWLSNKLFVPGMANCLAGLISTLVGVYTQQHGTWSITAKVTAIVEGSGLGVSGALFLVFDRFLLQKVKKSHGTHYAGWPVERTCEKGSGEKW